MRTLLLRALLLAVLVGLAVAGCTASISGPGDTAAVSFDVRVTGGIAGVDYHLRVDGTDRRLEVSCVSGCPDAHAGAFALGIEQWVDLVGQARDAGLPDLGDRDYGATCCDFFHLDIEFRDGLRDARVRGDSESFPPALAALSDRLLALAGGTLPVLVIPGGTPGAWPADPLTLDSVRVDGLVLVAGVTWTGGCRAHEIDLRFDGLWDDSADPVEARGWLTHDGRDDPCEALPSAIRRFDLDRLVEAYRAVHPGTPPGARIRLRLTTPGTGEDRTVDVVLP